jgi:hypothetical protein
MRAVAGRLESFAKALIEWEDAINSFVGITPKRDLFANKSFDPSPALLAVCRRANDLREHADTFEKALTCPVGVHGPRQALGWILPL